jgi:DNA-binding CsgD family transcriptional regulator
MTVAEQHPALQISLDERKLSIIVQALFSAWMLAFLFEGKILYVFADTHNLSPERIVFSGIAAQMVGLVLSGFVIRTKKTAKRLFLSAYPIFLLSSAAFFFPPPVFWYIGVIASSFLAGGCVAAWGFYFRCSTPRTERIRTAADLLIWSNILIIFLNTAAIHLSPQAGLALGMLMLVIAFLFALRLPESPESALPAEAEHGKSAHFAGLLAFLCLFIMVITINSGLMYQVITPAFAHLEWLTSWYWLIPYIIALLLMRNLSHRINRTYLLYAAIGMSGFSFICFVSFDRSPASYLGTNTLMMSALGIYDLFWWTILGELLDFHKNPARILGIGLAANVLGILLGGIIGSLNFSGAAQTFNATLLALAVVCITLVLLPPLHRRLSILLKDHAFLTFFFDTPRVEQDTPAGYFVKFSQLSERENQVACLLLQKKTYRVIAAELYISQNTVKYYVKNIYAKFNIQSRAELVDMALARDNATVVKQ